jgi:segregation and condensation protein A
MSDVLSVLEGGELVHFVSLFKAEEGRMGVTVTFIALLELMREGLIEVAQAEAYAPLHVRLASRRPAAVEADEDDAGSSAVS